MVYGLNAVDNRYIYQFMSTIQLTGSNIFDSHIQIYTGTQKYDVSLAKESQKHLKKSTAKMVSLIKENTKILMERKWTDRQYHIQDNSDTEHKYVKMCCNKNKFPKLSFCGPHSKPHGARGLNKNYHLHFDQKLGMGICAIHRIPCACVACTSMIYKPWISGIPPDEKERFKPVTKCTYCPVLGSFNNWNIIKLSQKSSPSDSFDEINQVVLDGKSDNMASLVESGKYGAIRLLKKKPMYFMLSCSHQNHIRYRITQQLMEKL